MDDFPIVPLEKLRDAQKDTLLFLSKRLERSDLEVFREIDLFFCDLYGLDDLDLEVVQDTLEVCLPYNESRERACQQPTEADGDIFRKRLEDLLLPFFEVLGKQPDVRLLANGDNIGSSPPFGFLTIGAREKPTTFGYDPIQTEILCLANETGATRIVQETPGGLAVGIFRQYRYWTPSRARLLAADILREHTVHFEDK